MTAANEAPEPVAGLNTSLTVDEGESVSASVNAVDPEGAAVTYNFDATNMPANGTLEWVNQSTGSFNYIHDDSDTTTDTFVINAVDPANNIGPITYTVTINPNLAPVLNVPVHEWYSCSVDADCSASSYGCCSCDYTSVATAYLSDYQSYYPAPDCSISVATVLLNPVLEPVAVPMVFALRGAVAMFRITLVS